MKAKLIIEGKEIEVEISEEEYKKIQTKEKKTGYERVEVCKEFYYVSASSKVKIGCDDYVPIDNDYYDIGNYYSDKFVAENNARADKLMRQLRRFAVEHREHGVNLNDINTEKRYICYDYESNELESTYTFVARVFGVIYFDSEETAQAAINEFHDELIWYFTEYKDSL